MREQPQEFGPDDAIPAVTLVSVIFIWFGLRPRDERHTAVAAVPLSKEADEELAVSLDRAGDDRVPPHLCDRKPQQTENMATSFGGLVIASHQHL
ncbi:MAG TPA: hypothetical protein VFT31_15510 [Kribbella sp.]|nr:hypothetical protein [Kribbella sp.]